MLLGKYAQPTVLLSLRGWGGEGGVIIMQEYKMPIREQNSNKGTFGKVLNFAGSKNYIGAAYLSTLGILKSGAGYAALATEENIIRSVSALLPEAVFLTRKEGVNNLNNYTVLLIGCGLGQDKNAVNLFKKVIKNAKCPLIIDADGLNILAKLNLQLPEGTIITPHPAEAARLSGIGLNDVLSDLEGCAKKLTEKYNCVTVLKTHRTIICGKENLFINQHGNSALAKAGSGDVLAGIIAGLLAQKMPPLEAAKLGVYLHSRSGEIASEELTEYSVLATDIPKYLPKAIKELL